MFSLNVRGEAMTTRQTANPEDPQVRASVATPLIYTGVPFGKALLSSDVRLIGGLTTTKRTIYIRKWFPIIYPFTLSLRRSTMSGPKTQSNEWPAGKCIYTQKKVSICSDIPFIVVSQTCGIRNR